MPMLRTVSIMPGMESRAPERQESSSGFFVEPNSAPITFSVFLRASSTWAFSSGGNWRSLA